MSRASRPKGCRGCSLSGLSTSGLHARNGMEVFHNKPEVAVEKSTKEDRRRIDRHVGEQLRTMRQMRGLSQKALAGKVDLTFQQLQKYERGANRISASVLYEFSRILDVSVEKFFEGLSTALPAPMPDLKKDHYTLIRLYDQTPGSTRKYLLKLLTAIAGEDGRA